MSKPIKIAIIGLSSNAATSWASAAHLPYLNSTDKYEIVALLNSSVESAKAAVEAFKLPSSTKTYGDPEDLAKDPDVQLVVCAVRVDKHLPTVLPSIKAGKDAYVEWPLASNLEEAQQLLEAAEKSNVKTIIGLQGRLEPVVVRVKELLQSGRIGGIRSVEVFSPQGSWSQLPESLEYFTDRKVGGNHVTIATAHLFDAVTSVVGELEPNFFSKLYNRIPKVDITKDGKVDHQTEKNTFDHVILHGTLKGSSAPFSFIMRNGRKFEGNPFVTWRIHGEKGDIQVTTPGPFLSVGYGNGTKITIVEDGVGEKIEEVDFGNYTTLPQASQNIARLYEAFANGETYPTFKEAVKLHSVIEKLYKDNQ